MRYFLLILLLLGLSFSPAHAQRARSMWAVGQQREVYPGHYAKLVEVKFGWRLWRLETKEGVYCEAFKSPIGRPHAAPSGEGLMFAGGTPYVKLYWDERRRRYVAGFLGARLFDNYIEWRRSGEKFWQQFDISTDIAVFDGVKIDVHVQTALARDSSIGAIDEYGTIDMTGTNYIVRQAQACTEAG